MRTRPALVMNARDQARMIAALERWADDEGFVGYRTRAFVYLLWDGALRTGSALRLNIEDVVRDSADNRFHIEERAMLRAREGDKKQGRLFEMTERTRSAIADYLKAARRHGWLVGTRLKGPLWIASQHRGTHRRLSQRTAVQAWHTFVGAVNGLTRDDLQLDDVSLTGRVAFAKAANASLELISSHAGVGTTSAARCIEVLMKQTCTRDVISRLNQQYRRT